MGVVGIGQGFGRVGFRRRGLGRNLSIRGMIVRGMQFIPLTIIPLNIVLFVEFSFLCGLVFGIDEVFFIVFLFLFDGWDGSGRVLGSVRAVVFLPVEVDAAAPVVGVLQAGEFAGEVLQARQVFVGILDRPQGVEGLADFEEKKAAHGFVGVAALVVFFDFHVLFGEGVEPVEALLEEKPILVAAVPPFGKVLVGDGFSGVKFGEDFFCSGEVVEPGEDGAAEFAGFEAAVELFADGGGEAGDFAYSCDHIKVGFMDVRGACCVLRIACGISSFWFLFPF